MNKYKIMLDVADVADDDDCTFAFWIDTPHWVLTPHMEEAIKEAVGAKHNKPYVSYRIVSWEKDPRGRLHGTGYAFEVPHDHIAQMDVILDAAQVAEETPHIDDPTATVPTVKTVKTPKGKKS